MNNETNSDFDRIGKSLFGDAINQYARGHSRMERHALVVVRPAIAALTLSEDFGSIILTSVMADELRKLILNALCKTDDAEEKLFEDREGPLGDLAGSTRLAYCCGLVTPLMYSALNAARTMRNCYAHSQDPADARRKERYIKSRRKLLTLDTAHTAECLHQLKDLWTRAEGVVEGRQEPNEAMAVMLNLCETLGTAAFFSLGAKGLPTKVTPAFFGTNDMKRAFDMEQDAAQPEAG